MVLPGGITWEYEQFCERRPAYSSQEDSPVATFRVSVMRPTLPVGFADQQALLERFIGSYLTIPSYQVHWGRDPFRYGETIPEAVRSLCDEWYEYYAGEAEAALAGRFRYFFPDGSFGWKGVSVILTSVALSIGSSAPNMRAASIPRLGTVILCGALKRSVRFGLMKFSI